MDNLFIMERLRGWLMAALPWAIGVMIFVLVCNYFFAPQLDNKGLGQHDIVQYEGMARDIKQHRQTMGEDPQWTGAMFSGMPAYLIDMEYPTQDVKQTVGSVVKVVDAPMNMILFAMIFMMIAVVLMGINPWIGIIAGLAYGLSTYFFLIIDAGHITKMWALVYAPPMVGAVWYALRRNIWVGAVLAALFGSLELAANHPQITYYFLFACLALWISDLVISIKERVVKSFAIKTLILAAAALLAGGSNFAPLWYAKSHQKHTVRGVAEESKSEAEARQEKIDWNTQWSYGRAECFNMLVPNYMGGATAAENVIKDNEILLNNPTVGNDLYARAQKYADEHIKDVGDEEIVNEAIELMYKNICSYYPDITVEDVRSLVINDDAWYEEFLGVCDKVYNQQYDTLLNEGNQKLNKAVYDAQMTYWGDQPITAGPTYLGAVVVFLAILGIFLAAHRNRWWLVAVSIFAILLAWGKNFMGFYELMYDWLPAYSGFRTVSMALVVVEWSVVVLAAYALMSLWRGELGVRKMTTYIALSMGVVLLLIVTMAGVADYGIPSIESLGDMWWVDELRDNTLEARSSLFWSDAWRTIGYVTATMAVLLIYALLKSRVANIRWASQMLPYAMLVMVAMLLMFDLVGVNSRYMNDAKWFDKKESVVALSSADNYIFKEENSLVAQDATEPGYRVFDLRSLGRADASYFHRSVDGYHGAKLGRYNEVLNEYIYDYNPNVLAMLNVKYLIVGSKSTDVITLKSNFGVEPMGAAWFVESPRYVDGAKAEFEQIATTDLRKHAVVQSDAADFALCYDTTGSITLEEYQPNYLRYNYYSTNEALAVFSEIYYPDGWTAYIDGVEADYFSANYILRAMELPAGEHVVEWRFKAPNWGVATVITGISSWLILIALLLLLTAPLSKRYVVPHIVKVFKREKR